MVILLLQVLEDYHLHLKQSQNHEHGSPRPNPCSPTVSLSALPQTIVLNTAVSPLFHSKSSAFQTNTPHCPSSELILLPSLPDRFSSHVTAWGDFYNLLSQISVCICLLHKTICMCICISIITFNIFCIIVECIVNIFYLLD